MSWQPSASIESLRQRASFIQKLRTFFIQRGYLEVETPCLSQYGITDVHLSNIQATFRSKTYNLLTSPEYPMKRLLAAGSGPIFQIAKVFRDDEQGRWHNPEFTMLEWYLLDKDHHCLMDEIEELFKELLNSKPLLRKTYKKAFEEACELNPFSASIKELRSYLKHINLDKVLDANEEDKDLYLYLLMSHVVEPYFKNSTAPIAIYDFPESQASLAKVEDGKAQRFEIYFQGVELANGFHELRDAKLQEQRFLQDLAMRKQKGFREPEIDKNLLQALEHGLPACSGVALGVDRFIALALKKSSVAEVLAFDFQRA